MNVDINSFWPYIAVIVGNGVLASLLTSATRKVARLEKSPVIHTVNVAYSAAGAIAQYIVQLHAAQPADGAGILGFLATFGSSQGIYKYSKYFLVFQNKVKTGMAMTKQLEASAQPAPAQATTDTTEQQDF